MTAPVNPPSRMVQSRTARTNGIEPPGPFGAPATPRARAKATKAKKWYAKLDRAPRVIAASCHRCGGRKWADLGPIAALRNRTKRRGGKLYVCVQCGHQRTVRIDFRANAERQRSVRLTPPCAQCHGTTFWDDRPAKQRGKLPPSAPDLRCADKQCRTPVYSGARALAGEGRSRSLDPNSTG